MRNKKQLKKAIKLLLDVPQRIQILGFYKGIPILHDPKNPSPDGEILFVNKNNFYLK